MDLVQLRRVQLRPTTHKALFKLHEVGLDWNM